MDALCTVLERSFQSVDGEVLFDPISYILPSSPGFRSANLPRILTDNEIGELLVEEKPLPHDWPKKLRTIPKANMAHKQRDYVVHMDDGREFRIYLRQNAINPMDFSIILLFVDTDKTEYTMTRFNGKHPSAHTNKIERNVIKNTCHIHRATERYQRAGYDIVGWAEATNIYSSFDTAVERFIALNGFQVLPDPDGQTSIFQSFTT